MKIAIFSALLLGLFMMGGCSSAPKESLADEKKALEGKPMPAGTWEKIAAQREKFNKEHGGGSGSPAGPTGAPTTGG